MATKELLRNNPVTSYLPGKLKQRAMRLAEKYPRYSVSRIIEESLVAHLPQLERELSQQNKEV